MILTTLTLALSMAVIKDKPVDITKSELPKMAVCVVCQANGEGHAEEKAVAGVKFKGASYFFCNAKEVSEFKKDPEAFIPPVLPRAASPLKATTLQNAPVTLENYKGKVVLLDFWATWCAPCVKSMPALDALYKKHKEAGLAVVGISIDEDPKKVAPFLAKKPVSYDILLDDAKEPTWAAYKVRAIPAIYLVDRSGQVVAQWKGEPKASELESAITRALKKG